MCEIRMNRIETCILLSEQWCGCSISRFTSLLSISVSVSVSVMFWISLLPSQTIDRLKYHHHLLAVEHWATKERITEMNNLTLQSVSQDCSDTCRYISMLWAVGNASIWIHCGVFVLQTDWIFWILVLIFSSLSLSWMWHFCRMLPLRDSIPQSERRFTLYVMPLE